MQSTWGLQQAQISVTMETFGRHNPGGNVAVRINPGFGIGHHEMWLRAARNQVGINCNRITTLKRLLRNTIPLVGINQHIGSLFMEGEPYIQYPHALDIAAHFEGLRFIDMGGGFDSLSKTAWRKAAGAGIIWSTGQSF